MKLLIITLVWWLAVCGELLAQTGTSVKPGPSLGFRSGYRVDQLDWNIGSGNAFPDVLSELTWRNLEMFHVGGEALIPYRNHLFASLTGSQAWATHGVLKV